jgi:putative ABC transport system substrate-binding protein
VQISPLAIRGLETLDSLTESVASEQLDGIITLMDSSLAEMKIIDIVTHGRLPSMCEARGHPMGGGLMSYGANPFVWYGRATEYIDKILKGAKPADLPVEQPTDFELVISMQRSPGSRAESFPPSILAQTTVLLQ